MMKSNVNMFSILLCASLTCGETSSGCPAIPDGSPGEGLIAAIAQGLDRQDPARHLNNPHDLPDAHLGRNTGKRATEANF